MIMYNKSKKKFGISQYLRISSTRGGEAEFEELEPWLKFETQLKYRWFPLKLNSICQDLSRRSIETGFWRI